MSNISNIETIYEFTSNDSGITYGAYCVTFKNQKKVFIRNGESVATVSHYLTLPASQSFDDFVGK